MRHVGFMHAILGEDYSPPDNCPIWEYEYHYGKGYRQVHGTEFKAETGTQLPVCLG